MKYYLIAGERSGDLHGSNLIKAIKQTDPTATFRAWGGDMMQAAGAEIVMNYTQMAFMGFVEVLMNLFTILGFISKCKKDILAYQPDVVILIDYAGFNMRIAQFAKQNRIRTFYYISPKVWAWNQNRALKIKQVVDKMFVIFPFEQSFFKKFDYDVDYVGNPLFDAIGDFKADPDFLKDNNISSTKQIVALLPGSRKQEVEAMLKVMLSVKNRFADVQFVIAGVGNLPKELYRKMTDKTDIHVVFDSAYDLLSVASAALVTSGTATLETALFNVPQVVCYKAGTISYYIAKWLIRVPYISLVNLIADKEVVKELIQNELTTKNLGDELNKIIIDGDKRTEIINSYAQIVHILGQKGASERAGKLMVQYLGVDSDFTIKSIQ